MRHHRSTKVHLVKAMVFPVVMYKCESWTIKKAEHQRIDAFELWCCGRLWRVPLDSKEIKPVNPKGNQPWIFIGRIYAEAAAPILWPPNVKSQFTWKSWCWERLRAGGERGNRGWNGWMTSSTQCRCVRANSDSEGHRSLACCSPWGHKESETIEQLNNNVNRQGADFPWGLLKEANLILPLEPFLDGPHLKLHDQQREEILRNSQSWGWVISPVSSLFLAFPQREVWGYFSPLHQRKGASKISVFEMPVRKGDGFFFPRLDVYIYCSVCVGSLCLSEQGWGDLEQKVVSGTSVVWKDL